ncbi:hypothetical protein LVD15_25400 [Fulvivirga maritima]|uniref:hypothetical protein n=1 Tax=Fulvivirga maritima TaxID=2904247 RepID=UPI001F25AADF|nr:hypothetical protein [Fulvivirga maritima]UII26592.1 hypothetical protein LVD15_25400 [Fulvivirga maritima]
MHRSLIILILLFVAHFSHAQDDYLVTLKRDTIKGEVQILLPSDRNEEIMFKTGDDKTRYKAYQFLEFYHEGEHYVPVKMTEKYAIMKVIKSGYLSLLSYRVDNNYDFGNLYLLKKTGEGTEVPTFLFKKVMADFLANCTQVSKKIENKEYKRSDIETIVDEFNNCIIRQTADTYSGEAPAKKSTPKVTDHPALSIIKNIKSTLAGYDTEETEDILALLSDLNDKISTGEKVPSYMIGALKEEAGAFDKIQADVEALVEAIK